MSARLHAQAKPSQRPSFAPVRTGILQRCGGHRCPPEGCTERRNERPLQRRPWNEGAPSAVPPIVEEVLRSPGQPLEPATRALMEPRFGHDFGRVRVHADAKATESARAVNALAYTVGRDVVFGAGQYASSSAAGQRLLAHELTHVVQQRRAAPGFIQRYAVEGPWNKNAPVHEVLTLLAITRALEQLKAQDAVSGKLLGGVDTSKFPEMSSTTGHNIEPKKIHRSAQQFIRGVIWPDDPKGYLFDEQQGTENYSSGLMWLEEFDPDEKDEPEELIARSHYGNLQFFHAMAGEDKEDPQKTQDKVLKWARFLTELSTGRIETTSKIRDNVYASELFPAHKDKTFNELLNYGKGSELELQQRAAGALMHLIQDSYAAGHVERDVTTGEVKQFHSYAEQDEHKHAAKDAWAGGKNLGEHIKNTPGATKAIEKCAAVLVMLDQGASTETVTKYLQEEIFKLDPNARAAGPGQEFKKK